MKSIVLFIEGRLLGYPTSIATGLIGGPVGALTGAYQSYKSQALQKELDEREGRTSTPVSGTKVALSAVGGFIPGLGAVTNMVNASDHYRNEDRLKPYENQDRLKSKQKTI